MREGEVPLADIGSRGGGWEVPDALQPRPDEWSFDVERVVDSIVGLSARVPDDAFTAEILGTERAGHGVVIEGGLVLTIGYLVTEADRIWLTAHDGQMISADVVGYDFDSGFALVRPLGRLNAAALPLGRADRASVGSQMLVAGAGGLKRSLTTRLIGRQMFAGYWEYLLDAALFVAPAHPFWGGTALIDGSGRLIGIGSLQLERAVHGGSEPINMMVPIDLLPPILDDLVRLGRPNRPARPWLGLYASDVAEGVVVIGLANKGPAAEAGVQTGDLIIAVGERKPEDLSGLFQLVWALGAAGVEVPLKLLRSGRTLDVKILSGDRAAYLKRPRLH